MITLTHHDVLPVNNLAKVFHDTTNSYKFYWFLAILHEIQHERADAIPMERLYKRMMEMVWYPLNYYKLSFGKVDGFKKVSDFVTHKSIEIDHSIHAEPLEIQLSHLDNESSREYNRLLKNLVRFVPYRFIRPFFEEETRGIPDQFVNKKIEVLAHEAANQRRTTCPYFISDGIIILNPVWRDYFYKNLALLKGFTFWHLVRFLHKNNPNVPGLPEKIFKPIQRDLRKSILCWKQYLAKNPYNCIYSGETLSTSFSLDHFIPWSFVAHDYNWNLIPTPLHINSSKGNRLPSLERYVDQFGEMQYSFYMSFTYIAVDKEIMEDYCNLFKLSNRDIFELPKQVFIERIKTTIIPLEQTALNMGYSNNWRYLNGS